MATKNTSTAATVKAAGKLGVGTLMIMNIVAVVSLRGLPAEAEYGMSSAFYYLFAALVFLIPVSLVAAELASMFPYQQGGMFRWIGEAFGSKLDSSGYGCNGSRAPSGSRPCLHSVPCPWPS